MEKRREEDVTLDTRWWGLRGRRVGGIGSGADDVDKINIGHWFRLGEVCGRQQRGCGEWQGRRQDKRKRV